MQYIFKAIEYPGENGEWGPLEKCPGPVDFVQRLELKIGDDPQDGAGATGMRLICQSGATISSSATGCHQPPFAMV